MGLRRLLAATAAAALVLVGAAAVDLGPAAVEPASTSTLPASTTPTSTPTSPPATGLEPGLVRAFASARAAAELAGHHLTITSGFRTAAEQQQLLDEEVRERGSLADALKWVFTPERSMHVRGLALDVGDGDAADWLDDHGARWGLCRTLAWEWWHFEWRERWQDARSCPGPVHDPADAPT